MIKLASAEKVALAAKMGELLAHHMYKSAMAAAVGQGLKAAKTLTTTGRAAAPALAKAVAPAAAHAVAPGGVTAARMAAPAAPAAASRAMATGAAPQGYIRTRAGLQRTYATGGPLGMPASRAQAPMYGPYSPPTSVPTGADTWGMR